LRIFTDLYASFGISGRIFTHLSASLAASLRIFPHLKPHLYASCRISSRIFPHLYASFRIFSRIFTHGIWLSVVIGGKSGIRSSSLGIKPHVVSSEPGLATIDLTENDAVAETEANCGIVFDPNAAATQLNSTSSVTKTAAAAGHSAVSRSRLSHTSQLLAASI
jgi:hypothetical protein